MPLMSYKRMYKYKYKRMDKLCWQRRKSGIVAELLSSRVKEGLDPRDGGWGAHTVLVTPVVIRC